MDKIERSNRNILALYNRYMQSYIDINKFSKTRDIEPNLMRYQMNMIKSMKHNGITMSIIRDDESLKKEGLKEGIEWLEISHIKGITVERGYNPFFEMSICDQSNAWRGLVKFSYNKEIADEKQYNNNFYKYLNNMILRAYINIVSPYRIKLTSKDGKTKLSNIKRFLVVENDLYRPFHGASLELPEDELLKMYRLNKWYITDIDNVMNGNPLLPKHSELNSTYVY